MNGCRFAVTNQFWTVRLIRLYDIQFLHNLLKHNVLFAVAVFSGCSKSQNLNRRSMSLSSGKAQGRESQTVARQCAAEKAKMPQPPDTQIGYGCRTSHTVELVRLYDIQFLHNWLKHNVLVAVAVSVVAANRKT